jgi:hypothetical protein
MIVLGDYAGRYLKFIIKGKGMERCGEVPLEKRVCDNHVGRIHVHIQSITDITQSSVYHCIHISGYNVIVLGFTSSQATTTKPKHLAQ